MLRKAICAVAVLAFSFSLAMADTFFGAIKKIEDGKITVATKFDRETKKFTEEKSVTLAKDVKVTAAKFKKGEKKVEAGDEIEGGLKNKRFQKIGERGIMASFTTNDDGQVTQINVFPEFRKKKKD